MRKILLAILICFCSATLFAQDDAGNNVFYKAYVPDTTGRDTLPPFTRHSFGFYFMPAYSFNTGTAVAPPYDANQIGVAGTTTHYSSIGPDKAAFGFSFGADYESTPFDKRLFYSVGLSMASLKYTGSAILVTVSPNSTYNSTQDITYSWSALTVNLPVQFHLGMIQNKKLRLDLGIGAMANFYASQSHTGDESQPGYDSFNLLGTSAIGTLGFEYFLGGSLIIKLEPCYIMSFTKSADGRKLSTAGIEVGAVFK